MEIRVVRILVRLIDGECWRGGGVNGIVGVKWVEFREFVDGVWWMVEVGIKNDVLLGIFGSGVGLG